MRWKMLFKRAYSLAFKNRYYELMYDLQTMTESELYGAIIFLDNMKGH